MPVRQEIPLRHNHKNGISCPALRQQYESIVCALHSIANDIAVVTHFD